MPAVPEASTGLWDHSEACGTSRRSFCSALQADDLGFQHFGQQGSAQSAPFRRRNPEQFGDGDGQPGIAPRPKRTRIVVAANEVPSVEKQPRLSHRPDGAHESGIGNAPRRSNRARSSKLCRPSARNSTAMNKVSSQSWRSLSRSLTVCWNPPSSVLGISIDQPFGPILNHLATNRRAGHAAASTSAPGIGAVEFTCGRGRPASNLPIIPARQTCSACRASHGVQRRACNSP